MILHHQAIHIAAVNLESASNQKVKAKQKSLDLIAMWLYYRNTLHEF